MSGYRHSCRVAFFWSDPFFYDFVEFFISKRTPAASSNFQSNPVTKNQGIGSEIPVSPAVSPAPPGGSIRISNGLIRVVGTTKVKPYFWGLTSCGVLSHDTAVLCSLGMEWLAHFGPRFVQFLVGKGKWKSLCYFSCTFGAAVHLKMFKVDFRYDSSGNNWAPMMRTASSILIWIALPKC